MGQYSVHEGSMAEGEADNLGFEADITVKLEAGIIREAIKWEMSVGAELRRAL